MVAELGEARIVDHGAGLKATPFSHVPTCTDTGDMSDRDDIRQPLDHLPPLEERDRAVEIDEPHYPGTGGADAGSGVSPATAAEPGDGDRHGVDKLPPSQR